jgi:GNAT superfamily N-acetyltransferase
MADRLTRLESGYAIKSFDCEDPDLNDFLHNNASKSLDSLLSVTYLIESDTECIAFFSILNDKIVAQDFDDDKKFGKFKKKLPHDKRYRSYPAVKIGRLGVTKNIQNKGTGRQIIEFLIQMFISNNRTGCRYITVDAYRQSLGFYEKMGFVFFGDKDKHLDTRAMYLDLLPYR